jgi:hypothetical protein
MRHAPIDFNQEPDPDRPVCVRGFAGWQAALVDALHFFWMPSVLAPAACLIEPSKLWCYEAGLVGRQISRSIWLGGFVRASFRENALMEFPSLVKKGIDGHLRKCLPSSGAE